MTYSPEQLRLALRRSRDKGRDTAPPESPEVLLLEDQDATLEELVHTLGKVGFRVLAWRCSGAMRTSWFKR